MTAINQGFMTFHRLTSSPLLLDSSHPIFVQKNEYLFPRKQSKQRKCLCFFWSSFRLTWRKTVFKQILKKESSTNQSAQASKMIYTGGFVTRITYSATEVTSWPLHVGLYTVHSLFEGHLFWKYLLVFEFPSSLLCVKHSLCMDSCVAGISNPGSL